MSDTNRAQISQIKESVYKVTPSGNLKILRITSENLSMQTTTVRSNEIRSDRQSTGIKRTNVQAGGGINFELSYGAFDDNFASVLMGGTWASPVTAVTADTGIAAAATGNRYTGADEEFATYTAGQWVFVSGFSNAANNGFKKILSITSSNPGTADNDQMNIANGTLVNESAGPAVTIVQGGYVQNGTTVDSYSIERKNDDATDKFTALRGIMYDGMTLNIPLTEIVNGSFTTLGATETSETATIGTGYTAAPTNDQMAAVDDVEAIIENNAALGATSVSITIANNLRARGQIGTLGAISIGTGEFAVSGSLQLHFDTKAILDRYRNFTNSSLAVAFRDTAGNGYVFDIPRLKFATGGQPTPGKNQDVFAELTFEAFMHATEAKTMRIARFPAA